MIDLDYAYLFTIIGLVYTYLAGHVGRAGEEGTFRALTRGYTPLTGPLEDCRSYKLIQTTPCIAMFSV